VSKPEKNGFPGFLFSATRNPGFKILPRIGNTSLTPQLVGTSTITDNLSPYIGSQTFIWSLVKVSSKLSSFPCAL